MIVPQRAVTELQGSYQVLVIDGQNKAHTVPVTVGERVGSEWIIEKGLHPGDKVVVEGIQKATPGIIVNPQPFQPQDQTNSPPANTPPADK
jgi:membrane fusion protein (multidrug efflux system)